SYHILAIGSLFLIGCINSQPDYNSRLCYEYPAEDWRSQAFHLSNGFLGVSFYGGVEEETFELTERSIWTGGPGESPEYSYGNKTGGKDYVNEIRHAITSGNVKLADDLVREHFFGDYTYFGFFSMVGSLHFAFDNHEGDYVNFIRELDLSKAVSTITYEINDVKYEREYFCSYPDRVLVIRFTSSVPEKLGFTMFSNVVQKNYSVHIDDNQYEIIAKTDGNDRELRVKIKIIHTDGVLENKDQKLQLKNASSATVILAAATEYLPEPPFYKGADPDILTTGYINRLDKLPYKKIKETHVKDYQNLYNRIDFKLEGNPEAEKLPTNERLNKLKEGRDDPGLKTLLFNFGRYVLISTSRPGGLPIAHAGTWNNASMYPDAFCCQGNIQSNVNVQLAYQPCGPLNLPECHRAYIDYIKDLVVPGRETAAKYYGTGGWVSHTTGNIWGYTAPGRSLMWGIYPVGAAWHCQHLWEQYAFTMDKDYLKHEAYPVMAEAAEFWLANLIPYREGLISAPTVAAEQGAQVDENGNYIDPTTHEYEAAREMPQYYRYNIPGAFQDIEMVWDLFTNVLEAAEVLGIYNGFTDSVRLTRELLTPLKIGRLGQLQEWYPDIDSPENHHRHISNLYAVHPGRQIDPLNTPELAEAAKKSLQLRGYGRFEGWPNAGGGWSQAWRIYCWARLLDCEMAGKIFEYILKEKTNENMRAGGWDACIAFPGCMAEMLLQSHLGEIHLLPALPSSWPDGKVEGLIARGGYKINVEWKEGQLHEAKIISLEGGVPKVRVNGKTVDLNKEERIKIYDQ
ncbi:glycoside hydrolase N-terminal domain-containing protein, partial [Bacteroidota bacterium]